MNSTWDERWIRIRTMVRGATGSACPLPDYRVSICSRNSYPSVGMKRKLGPKGQVVIPKDIRDKLSLTEGAILDFEVEDDAIVVRPEPSPEEFVGRFLSVKGKKLRKRVDWKSVLDDEYKVAGR